MRKTFFLILLISALTASAQNLNKLSVSDKIYGLSKFWQEVNYNFVYFNRIDKVKWDSLYKAILDSVQKTNNDFEYYRDLQKFAAFLKDGHTDVNIPTYIDSTLLLSNFGEYRFFVRNIDDKAIITQINTSKKNEIPVGSEIVEVNGLSTKNYIEKYVEPFISSSTEYGLKNIATGEMFLGFKGDKYLVKIKTPDNVIKEFNLVHKKTAEQALFPPNKNFELLEFKWYSNQIAYCAINSFDDPKVDTLFKNLLPQLTKAKALIIDLRKNGGGSTNIGLNVLQYLTNDTLFYGSKSVTRILNSTYNAYGKFIEPQDTVNGRPEFGWTKEDCLKYYQTYHGSSFYEFPYSADTIKKRDTTVVIPTAILIGHGTASAAEDFLIYADNQKNMIKIGENSYGSTGQPLMFDLPGGGSARVCTKKDIYPDGREFVRYGVKPHMEVKTTVGDFINNNDPVIKKAIEYLTSKIKR